MYENMHIIVYTSVHIMYNSVIDDRIELPYLYYLCECAEKH